MIDLSLGTTSVVPIHSTGKVNRSVRCIHPPELAGNVHVPDPAHGQHHDVAGHIDTAGALADDLDRTAPGFAGPAGVLPQLGQVVLVVVLQHRTVDGGRGKPEADRAAQQPLHVHRAGRAGVQAVCRNPVGQLGQSLGQFSDFAAGFW